MVLSHFFALIIILHFDLLIFHPSTVLRMSGYKSANFDETNTTVHTEHFDGVYTEFNEVLATTL